MKKLSVLCVSLLMVLLLGVPGLASDAGVQIAVRGEAMIEVQPDLATVYLFVESQALSAEDAHKDIEGKVQILLKQLEQLGIPDDAIETRNFQIFSVAPSPEPPRPVRMVEPDLAVGMTTTPPLVPTTPRYRAIYDIQVTLTDLDLVGPVIASAASASAGVRYISFGVQNDVRYRNQLLSEAVRDAREKAEVIAKALGTSIKRVVSVDEIGSNYRFAQKMGYMESGVALAYADAATPAPINPGTQELHMIIRAVFEGDNPRRSSMRLEP